MDIITIVVLLFIVIVVLTSALRVVPEYKRLVVFTLGRFREVRGPGLTLLLPFVDKGIEVDLREQEHTIYDVEATFQDTTASMEVEIEYRIVDPARVLIETADINRVLARMVRSIARSALIQHSSDAESWQITNTLQAAIEATQDEYGIRIHEVEIDHIEPLRHKRKEKEKRKNEEF